nr:uncharacterized protein LOC113805643 [Penaeus vannamei]
MLSYIVASMLGPLFITKDFEKDTVRRTSLDAALRPVLARHGNMTQLITKLSYRCEDLIMQCYNIMFTLPGPQCCQKLFRSTITPIGVCYRSAFDSHFTQVMPGEGMGINIDLHVPLHTEAVNDINEALQSPNPPTLTPPSPPPTDLDWSILKENLHTVSGLQISIINSISIPSLKVLGERVVIQPNTKVSVAVDHSVLHYYWMYKWTAKRFNFEF